MLRAACRAAAKWEDGVVLGVELSPARWHDPSTGLRVLSVLGETGLPPARLELEIPDNVLIGGGRAMCRGIEELREAGVMVALTGCGLRADLSAPPVCFDTLKIADTVIAGLGRDRLSDGTVDALITLAADQGAVAAAAGITTETQLTMLDTKGCAEGQGSLFGKPTPAANIGAMLRYPSIAAAVA
ncbi:MAG: EAL domain-containing protein [Pseudolabrys sp.]|nr:EAL domain-containing protein [Pseudolabrys sp.]